MLLQLAQHARNIGARQWRFVLLGLWTHPQHGHSFTTQNHFHLHHFHVQPVLAHNFTRVIAAIFCRGLIGVPARHVVGGGDAQHFAFLREGIIAAAGVLYELQHFRATHAFRATSIGASCGEHFTNLHAARRLHHKARTATRFGVALVWKLANLAHGAKLHNNAGGRF